MSLRPRDRQLLYHELEVMLRSGRPAPSAVESILRDSTGAVRRLLKKASASLKSGATLTDALTGSGELGRLETSVVRAGEKSGRLEQSCHYLSRHFGMLAELRSGLLRRSAYPVFILLLGVFLANAQLAFTDGFPAYAQATLQILGYLVLGVVVVGGLGWWAVDAGRSSPLIDWLLMQIPVAGGVRRSLSVARFCATYSMSAAAGINVIDSMTAAGEVSHSAQIKKTCLDAIPSLRQGAQISPLLAKCRAVPRWVIRSFRTAEETGRLDEEMAIATDDLQRDGQKRVEILTEWVPRLLYLAVVGYVGYRIILTYQGTLNQLNDIMSQ